MFVSALLFSCGNNEDTDMVIGEYTKIEVKKIFDAGTVAKGTIIEAKFEIENVGKFPFVIADVHPSCSCTVPDFEESPIPPGGKTVITAYVDTDRTGTGKLEKPITITANTKPSTTELVIKANVKH